jgi:acetyl-CoA carboxylase carboxyl transferase subunit alpha
MIMSRAKLAVLPFEKPIAELQDRLTEIESSAAAPGGVSDEVRRMRKELDSLIRKVYSGLSAWQTVQVARHPNRPQTADYVDLVFDEFLELHGDRAFGDDRALTSGFARLGDFRTLLIGHQKGRHIEERGKCFFGCAHPEGYRKALAKMKLAERYRIPVVCFIDTPGAYPGIGAEERGQSMAIAVNLLEMSRLKTPIVCVVIGEGGSGGALGIGVGDRVGMLEHAYYSVISPEGCSGILWKDGDKSKELAAAALRLTSKDLSRLGVIDEVITEPLGGAHRDHHEMAQSLRSWLQRQLRELTALPLPDLVSGRHRKFRAMGQFLEEPAAAAAAIAS